jgi:hypothetical protein
MPGFSIKLFMKTICFQLTNHRSNFIHSVFCLNNHLSEANLISLNIYPALQLANNLKMKFIDLISSPYQLS